MNEEAVEEHLGNLQELRRMRDTRKVRECLENLRQVAGRREENLCPAIREAVIAHATLGEIMGTIRLGYNYNYDPFEVLEYLFRDH